MKRMHHLRVTGIGIILLILAIAPFYQGLFFPVPMLTAITALVIGFGLWAYGRQQNRLPIGVPGGWAASFLLLLVLAYLIQFGWAAYARGNLDWLLRTIAAWMVFVIIAQESTPTTRRWLGWTLVVGTAVVAFIGILEYGQFFEQFEGLREFLNIKKYRARLGSVYQYPNAAAGVMFAAWIAGSGLALQESSAWRRGALSAMLGLMSVALLLTLSRGIIVVIPAGILLLLVGLSWNQMLSMLLYVAATMAIPLAVAFKPITAAGTAGNWGMTLFWVLLAAGAGTVAAFGAEWLARKSGRRLSYVLVGLVVAAIAAGGVWVSARPIDKVLPSGARRLLDFSVESRNAQSRLQFGNDALRIFMDQPWGYGGFGWDRTYRQYQKTDYTTRETHNHYAQVLVEAGALGIIAIFGALMTALWTGFRNRTDDPARWAMVAAGGALAAHAFLDFDLSFPSIWLLMWALLATSQNPLVVPHKEPKSIAKIAMVSSLLLGILCVNLSAAAITFRQAEYAVINRQYEVALAKAKSAIALDPINSQHLKLLRTEETLGRAIAVDPFNPVIWNDLAILREKKNDPVGALDASSKAIEINPMSQDRYEAYFGIADGALNLAVEKNNRALVAELTKRVNTMSEQFEARRAPVADEKGQLRWTPSLYLTLGKVQMLTGDLSEAEKSLLLAAKDKSVVEEASLWLQALYSKQGVKKKVPKPPTKDQMIHPLYQVLLKW